MLAERTVDDHIRAGALSARIGGAGTRRRSDTEHLGQVGDGDRQSVELKHLAPLGMQQSGCFFRLGECDAVRRQRESLAGNLDEQAAQHGECDRDDDAELAADPWCGANLDAASGRLDTRPHSIETDTAAGDVGHEFRC